MNKINKLTPDIDPTIIENKSVVILIGTTGNGKSACANRMVQLINGDQQECIFVEGDTSQSCTDQIQYYACNDFVIIDTPGLYDSNGEKADVNHIRNLIDFLQTQKTPVINAIILVMNGQQDRLDRSMRDSVKLFIDSFGHACVAHLGLIFTKCTVQHDYQEKAHKIRELLSNDMYIRDVPEQIPFWHVDCHPERLGALGVPENIIQERNQSTSDAFDQIVKWVREQPQYDTQHASLGCFDYVARVASLEQQYQQMLAQQKFEYELTIKSLQEKLNAQQQLSDELSSVIITTQQRIENQSSVLHTLRDIQEENAENLSQTSNAITGTILENLEKSRYYGYSLIYNKSKAAIHGQDTPEETDQALL